MYTLKYTKEAEAQKILIIMDNDLLIKIQRLEERIKKNPHNGASVTEKNCFKTSIIPTIPSNTYPSKILSIEYTINEERLVCNILSVEYKV